MSFKCANVQLTVLENSKSGDLSGQHAKQQNNKTIVTEIQPHNSEINLYEIKCCKDLVILPHFSPLMISSPNLDLYWHLSQPTHAE